MASMMTVNMILVGPRAGATVSLRKYDFVGGVCRITGETKAVLGAAKYLGKCYNAFIDGSDELAVAQAKWADLQKSNSPPLGGTRFDPGAQQNPITPGPVASTTEVPDGKRDADPSPEPNKTAPVHGSDGSNGDESPPVSDPQRSVDADPPTGDSGGVPSGDRHQDTRVPPQPDDAKRELIEAALSALDHGKDDHWTQDGKPAVAVVTDVAGENISRQMIDVVAPDFVRNPPTKTENK